MFQLSNEPNQHIFQVVIIIIIILRVHDENKILESKIYPTPTFPRISGVKIMG